MRTKFAALVLMSLGLGLSACGTTMEQKAATGAVAGAATEVATERSRKP